MAVVAPAACETRTSPPKLMRTTGLRTARYVETNARLRRAGIEILTNDVVVTHGNGPHVGLALQGDAYQAVACVPGWMGPKVDAACRVARRTGGVAGIGQLADAAATLAGTRGTRVQALRRAAA